MSKKYYVTTPIYYVTDKPHLGHLYSTLIADVLARWNRLQAKEVFFLTGTDEHGQKIAQAAELRGVPPRAFVDQFIDAYKSLWQKYEISYSKFIHTTDQAHINAVQTWLRMLIEKGDIYKDRYTGWYCVSCELFVTEHEASGYEGAPPCSACKRATQSVSEETYFFRLSKYQDALLRHYEQHPEFIMPKERAAEVISFVKSGLKDLSISRTTVKWGIPFPDDDAHVAYVWADALCNYITGVGFAQKDAQKEFAKWWPADVQVMGKDIVRFHAIYWPAFLMASDLGLPKTLLVHGWIKVNEQKMSKSIGNVVDPVGLYDLFGADPVRYYLMRQLAVSHDAEFSTADLEQRITSDLANDLGNLHNRMVQLAHKNNMFEIDPPQLWSQKAISLRDECISTVIDYESYIEEFQFHLALARLWKFINDVNGYFHEAQPWKLASSDPGYFREIISATAHSLHTIAILLLPIMPEKMERLIASLGLYPDFETNVIENLKLSVWIKPFLLRTIEGTLFKKPETAPESPEPQKEAVKAPETSVISIDDFAKVELLVGTITSCQPIEKSDKLYQLQVDLGPHGIRQILSGVRKHFTPEQLIGTQGVFVANLKPRAMMGIESHGMMLLAEDEKGQLQPVRPAGPVPNGMRLR